MKIDNFFTSEEAYHYFCGLTISDGHMSKKTRNRGNITIELKKSDSEILYNLQNNILVYSSISERTRDSNFAKSFTSTCLRICNWDFRNFLENTGIPYGSKANVEIPDSLTYNKDFWRGMIDGDGSLGTVKDGRCFISFVTKSEPMALGFVNLVEKITGQRKIAKRNKRDGVFNFIIFCENAQSIVSYLEYDKASFFIKRKKNQSENVLYWKRPKEILKQTWEVKRWAQEEDKFILTHSINESVEKLKRTKKSIKSRLWRIS